MSIKDLPEVERKVVRRMIRAYCKKVGMYGLASEQGVGLEATEEAIEGLIDKGFLVIQWLDKEQKFRIMSTYNDSIDFEQDMPPEEEG